MSAQRTKGGRGKAQFSPCLAETERCELLLTQAAAISASLQLRNKFRNCLVPLQGVGHGLGDSAGHDAAGDPFHQTLDAHHQDDEHKGVHGALGGHHVLDKVRLVEDQHDVAHEEDGIQHGGGESTGKVAPDPVLVQLLEELEEPAGGGAHEAADHHAEDDGEQGAQLKENASHGGRPCHGVIQTGETVDRSQNGAAQRAKQHGTDGNGDHGQGHHQGTHRNGGQVGDAHHQDDGDEDGVLRDGACVKDGSIGSFFHMKLPPCLRFG